MGTGETAGRSHAGSVDINVHFGPDIVPRTQTATGVFREAIDSGFAAICLRSHTASTADIANALDELAAGSIRVAGSITLNLAVGGINPDAAEVALKTGARIVSLPTRDSEAEDGLRAPDARRPWVPIVDDWGDFLSPVHDVIELAAHYGAGLDLGATMPDHVLPLIRLAKATGVENVIVSHPVYPAQRYSVALQREAADAGAFIEHCYTQFDPAYPGGGDLRALGRLLGEIGPTRVILSSDTGKPGFPTSSGAFDALRSAVAEHCSSDDWDAMTARNPAAVLGL